MGSRETFPRPENPMPENIRSGSLGSQFGKYQSRDTRVPQGQEWAFILIQKIPDIYKKRVTDFILSLPHEDRQKAGEHLSEIIDGVGDQIWRSKYPEVEISKCIEETDRWIRVNRKEAA